MGNCSMCGMDIPDGQGVCSMCYGDPFFGSDGYYLAEMVREIRSMEDLKSLERVMQEENLPLEDDDWDYEDNPDEDEANELPF